MSGKRDPYEVLGVGKDANNAEINKAYRKLALEFHPDRNHGDHDAAERFKEVNDANDILSDPDTRERYDRYGFAGLQNGMPAQGDGPQSIIDMMNDFASAFFGGGGRGPRGGRDLQVEINITLEEAARGAKKPLTLPREEHCGECTGSGARKGSRPATCRQCNGQGVRVLRQGFFSIQQACAACRGTGSTISDPCPACRGHGRVSTQRKLEINIPPGVDTGVQIRYQGEGEDGERGSARGDLYCVIRVKPHPIFQREGQHLICQVPVAFSQAALGAEIDVPTLDGVIKHKLKRGINSHELERIHGQGMPNRRGARGDLIVQVVVETPKTLTKRQEELLRELAEIEQKNVSPERKSFVEKIRDFFQTDTEK